jgi:hypothetical protein
MMIVNEGPLLAQSGHWPRQEAIEIQGRTREASRSCGEAPFNRVFEESQIASVADVQRARLEGFEDRRRGGKFRPHDLVGKIPRQSCDFKQRAIAALLIADAQRNVPAASADAVVANPIAAPSSVAPKLRMRARVSDLSLIVFMLVIFLIFVPLHCLGNQRSAKPMGNRIAVNEMAD